MKKPKFKIRSTPSGFKEIGIMFVAKTLKKNAPFQK